MEKKVGLALSGGAARGLAHIGVIEALEKAAIPIDIIAGTSAGALIGSAYAWKQDVERMKRYAMEANWKNMRPLIDVSFPKSGFVKGRKLRNLMATYVGGNTTFADLKIPFACTATDINTGEEVILNSGPVADALRITIGIPGIFTLVKREGRYLVDGGLTTPVPVHFAREMGADFVIAVNVNPDVSARLSKTGKRRVTARKEPGIFQVLSQSIYITTYCLAESAMEQADAAIRPELDDYSGGDFNRAGDMIKIGYDAAMKAVPEILEKLGN